MAHFAKIEENSIVARVIVVHNNVLLDDNGGEQESLGAYFCSDLLGGNWVQTSYNGNFRKNFAGEGFKYDAVRDAFIAPQPYPSWILDEETCTWDSPVPRPEEGRHEWDENNQEWVPVE